MQTQITTQTVSDTTSADTEEITTPALFFEAEHEGYFLDSVEVYNTLEEAKADQSKYGGILFDYARLEEQYLESRREEWGILGGWTIDIGINTETGETKIHTYDKNSGAGWEAPWTRLCDAHRVGHGLGTGVLHILQREKQEELAQEYWDAVNGKFDELLEEKRIVLDDKTRIDTFNGEDGGDGQGGTPHPESLAEYMIEKLEEEAIERGAALICEITVDHRDGPDGFNSVEEATEFIADLEEQGEEATLCFFRKDNLGACDKNGVLL